MITSLVEFVDKCDKAWSYCVSLCYVLYEDDCSCDSILHVYDLSYDLAEIKDFAGRALTIKNGGESK